MNNTYKTKPIPPDTLIFDDLFSGWRVLKRAHHADGARDRVERLWLSPNTETLRMFSETN